MACFFDDVEQHEGRIAKIEREIGKHVTPETKNTAMFLLRELARFKSKY